MGIEEENAAKWEMVEKQKKLRSTLAVLETKAKTIGQSFMKLGQILQSPRGYEFITGPNKLFIVAGETTRLEVDSAYFDSKALAGLSAEIQATAKEKTEIEQSLRAFGLEVADQIIVRP